MARLDPGRAIATYYSKPIDHSVRFDSLSMSLSDVVEEPESISHAVILMGDVDPESCAADVGRSNALNVDSIKSVIDYLRHWRIKPVFASSEFVFDGTKGGYLEDDPVSPILTYGRQKVAIEEYLRDSCEEYVIVRLAKVFGRQGQDGTLFTKWIDAIQRSQTIYCAYDQVFSPIYVEDVVAAIIRLIEMDCNGLFHLSSLKPFSRIELLEMLLAQIGEYSSVQTNVVPCSIHDFDLREKRPLNVSMRPDKLVRSVGAVIRDVEDICGEIVRAAFRRDCHEGLS